MDSSPPSSSVHEFPRQEYWSGLSYSPPGDFPSPWIKPTSPSWTGVFLTAEPVGSPCYNFILDYNLCTFINKHKPLVHLINTPKDGSFQTINIKGPLDSPFRKKKKENYTAVYDDDWLKLLHFSTYFIEVNMIFFSTCLYKCLFHYWVTKTCLCFTW